MFGLKASHSLVSKKQLLVLNINRLLVVGRGWGDNMYTLGARDPLTVAGKHYTETGVALYEYSLILEYRFVVMEQLDVDT